MSNAFESGILFFWRGDLTGLMVDISLTSRFAKWGRFDGQIVEKSEVGVVGQILVEMRRMPFRAPSDQRVLRSNTFFG
jgi:hypothetical protein